MNFNFLKKDSTANPKLRDLLRNNMIGTPGKSMVYQHQLVDEKLDHIEDPNFVSVGLRKVFIGTCCFCKRIIYMNARAVRAYYVRYFTFRDRFRSGPYRSAQRGGALKREVKQLLEGKFFDEKDPHIYYAYIDPGNLRSIRLGEEFGFRQSGSFRTVFFSRFFPKRNDRVSKISDQEREEVIGLLKRDYADHDFLSFENIFYQGMYFVYKKDGKIVAGIQASPESWKVYELPGANGRLLLNGISKLPVMKRLFNKDFHFLSVEGIYCEEGAEQCLQHLLEDALARTGVYSAIMCLDPDSGIYRKVKKMDQGTLSRVSKERSFLVMAKAAGMDLSPARLSYVSAFDVM